MYRSGAEQPKFYTFSGALIGFAVSE